jgi:hypothetical protein
MPLSSKHGRERPPPVYQAPTPAHGARLLRPGPARPAAELLALAADAVGDASVCADRSFQQRRDAAIIAVFTATVIRLSDVANLRYDPDDPRCGDIDLWQREIIVCGKGGKTRTVKIGYEAARSRLVGGLRDGVGGDVSTETLKGLGRDDLLRRPATQGSDIKPDNAADDHYRPLEPHSKRAAPISECLRTI